MPSTISDFNLSTRKLRVEFGVDINNDGVAERTFEDNLQYINIFESVDQVAGIKYMQLDAELFIPNPSTRWSRSGIATYALVRISSDDWSTNNGQSLFVGTTIKNNTVPVNSVKIRSTTFNDDILDKKTSSSQVFLNQDIATIMTTLLTNAGVNPANISLPATGKVLPVYYVSSNWTLRYYINDLAKGAMQVVGFNRSGIFSSNTILKNDFDGTFPTPSVTMTLDDIIDFGTQEIRSNTYFNDITVRSYDFDYLTDVQYYKNAELSGYEIKANSRLYFEIEFEDMNPVIINTLTARNSNLNLLTTWGYKAANSYYEFFTADENGSVNNLNITLESVSIIPSDEEGQDKVLIVFRNSSSTTSFFLKQVILNGSCVQRRPVYEVNSSNPSKIIEDGQRLSLVYESNAIQSYVGANTILSLLELNLTNYANIYKFEIRGRPQLEVGSVIQFQNRATSDIVGVVFEIDTEISEQEGFSQILTVRTLADLGNYLALDDATRGLDDTNYQLL